MQLAKFNTEEFIKQREIQINFTMNEFFKWFDYKYNCINTRQQKLDLTQGTPVKYIITKAHYRKLTKYKDAVLGIKKRFKELNYNIDIDHECIKTQLYFCGGSCVESRYFVKITPKIN